MDLTGDGRFTISDIWALFELLSVLVIMLFFLPANLILIVMYWLSPEVPAFFELRPTYEYTMGWGTGIASGVLWLTGGSWIHEILEERENRRREAEQARREEERRRRYDEE